MIWEVDEDCDGLVDWPEFQAMWGRCRQDKAGEWAEAVRLPAGWRLATGQQVRKQANQPFCHILPSAAASAHSPPCPSRPARCAPAGTEPRGLYNVVLFLLHDRGGKGRVTLEEAMKITYLRVGKVGAARCITVRRWVGVQPAAASALKLPVVPKHQLPNRCTRSLKCHATPRMSLPRPALPPAGVSGLATGRGVWHRRPEQRQDTEPHRVPHLPAPAPAATDQEQAYHEGQQRQQQRRQQAGWGGDDVPRGGRHRRPVALAARGLAGAHVTWGENSVGILLGRYASTSLLALLSTPAAAP